MKLKTKIIGIVVFVCSLLIVSGTLAFYRFAKEYRKETFDAAADSAKILSDRIGAQFYERYGDVQAFAENPYAKELNELKLPFVLDKYVELYGIYDVILIVDKEGRYVGSNTKDTRGRALDIQSLKAFNYSTTPWFKNAMDEKWTSDVSKGFNKSFFESIHVDPVYALANGEKNRTGTSFTALVRNEKEEIVGVITNRANNKWFEAEMAAVYSDKKLDHHEDSEVTLLDKDGWVIANLAPKHHDGKLEFDTDESLFKDNFFKNHIPAGEEMSKHGMGAMISKDINDSSSDLVGYSYLDNYKWVASIGWTAVVHEDAENALMSIRKAETEYYLFSLGVAFVGVVFAVLFGVMLSKQIGVVVQGLDTNSKEVFQASNQIAKQAVDLSNSTTEQAAALQETAAAIDQINAMITKNSDAAVKSKEVSSLSREAAIKGQEKIGSMIKAIRDIDQSNQEVSLQMTESNSRLADITKLIKDIETKTKVINEIVFQTKLLSFNASVEAARAGEYGKGFSVVAEEVGNLAQMSGAAAKEITNMLDQSAKQVEYIFSETKIKVEKSMKESRSRVEIGSNTANECRSALEEILMHVSGVDSLVSEIAVASQEQSSGVAEVAKATGQMDQVTQKNSSSAQMLSSSAENLNQQSTYLDSLVKDLLLITEGNNQKNVSLEKKVISINSQSSQKEKKLNEALKLKVVKSLNKTTPEKTRSLDKPSPEPTLKRTAGDIAVPSSEDPGFENV